MQAMKWTVRALALALIVTGMAGNALAVDPPAPELDPGSMASALTLLSGGLLWLSARRKRA